jgi:hypothetical protein
MSGFSIKRVAIVLAVIVPVTLLLGSLFMAESHEVHPHAAELVKENGSWKYTNDLIHETSPYLLQHAHNPVDWHPWGQKAFDLARKTGKPIFMSIGYSTCYWCHVMERQVFENPEIAALMNEHFVNIKVDREERPDVDDIYMIAVQVMTGSGGWPMSMFLTPPEAGGKDDRGLKPFSAATYIPPESMRRAVVQLSDAWKNERPKVLEISNSVAETVSNHLSKRDAGGPLSEASVTGAAKELLSRYDTVNGGFATSPKFPSPANVLFLMRVYQKKPDQHLWKAIAHTLDRMARGGMYDQVGGGFHRYSTDEKWLVPHFEKMLYDNGMLIEAYLSAHAIKPHEGDPTFYSRIVMQTCDYILREMVDDTGTFWSAQDAEVNAREGLNYLWQSDEVEKVIGEARLAKLAMSLYGLDKGSNFQDPHDRGAPRANVLFVPEPYDKLAQRHNISLHELISAKEEIDRCLLKVRNKREQPSTDDKVLTAWNGLMIAGMARAGHELEVKRYTDAAAKAAGYILDKMRTEDGGLFRTMRKGQSKIPAFLEDYAYFMHGLIEMHRADGNPRWLDGAKQLMVIADRQFADEAGGGYYDTLADQSDLFVRVRTTHDGALPSGNSMMAMNLADLYELTGEAVYIDRAIACLAAFASTLEQSGAGVAHMQHALLRVLDQAPLKVAAVDAPDAPGSPKTAQSQPAGHKPLTYEISPKEIDLTSGAATAKLTLTVGSGYHINANQPGVRSVVPTTVALVDAPGMTVQINYPVGEAKNYDFADQTIRIYEGRIELTLAIMSNPTVQVV